MTTDTPNHHDAELEAAILGACLIERTAMPLVADNRKCSTKRNMPKSTLPC